MEQRIDYFDFLRGIAILKVIGIHTYLNHYSSNVAIIVRQILNCAVPLFLAISGYFLSKKHLTTFEEKKKFWIKQIPPIYIPCLVWSIPWLLLSIIHNHSVIISLAYFFLCGYSIYYFVALIIQYYFLLAVLKKMNNPFWRGVCLISGISIVIVSYLLYFKGYDIPLLIYAGFAPLWIAFFYLGILLSERSRVILSQGFAV